MLMDLATGEWDQEMLGIFDVPQAMLPKIVPSSGRAGLTAGEFAGIPIGGVAGDQQAALAGQACFRAGLSKNTYGTGCFALAHTGSRQPHSTHRLLGTRAASFDAEPQFAMEGSVFVAGAAIQWLRDSLGLIGTAARIGGPRRVGAGYRRRLYGAGLRRAGRAALGFGRARCDQRPHAGQRAGGNRARGARKHRLSEPAN